MKEPEAMGVPYVGVVWTVIVANPAVAVLGTVKEPAIYPVPVVIVPVPARVVPKKMYIVAVPPVYPVTVPVTVTAVPTVPEVGEHVIVWARTDVVGMVINSIDRIIAAARMRETLMFFIYHLSYLQLKERGSWGEVTTKY